MRNILQQPAEAVRTTALEARTWENFALGNAAIQTDIPVATIERLLQIHWAWIAPMFNWVYRPAFMRELPRSFPANFHSQSADHHKQETWSLVVGGPSYSPFLLTVLCAHTARFDSRELSELLIARARSLLGAEIRRPSSISTAQALLQLSARNLAYGLISQAWLYSSMAFRMVGDLGLHHSTGRIETLGSLNAEDFEIRRRLFWSCYFWDRAMSLYLGREPVLTDLPLNHSLELREYLEVFSTEVYSNFRYSQLTTRPKTTCGPHTAESPSTSVIFPSGSSQTRKHILFLVSRIAESWLLYLTTL
jgi:hypothetical protein